MLHFCTGVIPGHQGSFQAFPEGFVHGCSPSPLQMNHLCWGMVCGQGELGCQQSPGSSALSRREQ